MDAFSTICTGIFDKHAPKKSEIYDLNLKPFINNEISKAITTRDSLKIFF